MAARTAGPEAREPAAPTNADAAAQPTVENRWWVDANTSTKRRGPVPPNERETPPIVGRLFNVGRDFDQDRAKVRLTDANLQILREANPPEDAWGYVPMTEQRSGKDYLEKVKRALRLPRGSRGVLVDSGTSLRAIATGNPFGDRVVEREPSLVDERHDRRRAQRGRRGSPAVRRTRPAIRRWAATRSRRIR